MIEQLEKYWVLAIVHTSTRSVPPQALAIMAHRLKRFVIARAITESHLPKCSF
jgi:hypothetical protein